MVTPVAGHYIERIEADGQPLAAGRPKLYDPAMRCVAVAGLALVLWLPLQAEAHRQREAQTKHTARLSGRVVAADTGKPLRRASVTISAPNSLDPRVIGPGGHLVTTNDDGVWRVGDLPAGRYRVAASKAGYVTTQYGQRHARASARIVELAAGASLDRIDLQLPKASAITGRILDDAGEPASPALVTAMRIRYENGERTLAPLAEGVMAILTGGLTDDRGEYRIHGLSPGVYYLSAVAEAIGPAQGGPSVLAPTFYPGTPNLSAAQPITVHPGEDALEISFSLARVRAARVAGTVVNGAGAGTRAEVRLTSASRLAVGGQIITDAAGGFNMPAVPPGDYRLEVHTMKGDDAELGVLPLSVSGEDVTDLVIATRPPGTASGKVVTDDGSRLPAGVTIEAAALASETFPSAATGRRTLEKDGTFRLRGLLESYTIRTAAPAGWFLASVTLDGKDITDSGHEFRSGQDVTGIEVTLTRHATTLRGAAVDGTNARLVDYTVLAFSTDDRRWGRHTRHVQTGRPNNDGNFTLEGLPPDEYFVIALDYLEPGEETDRARLDGWKGAATRVTVSDDRPAVVTLKLKR